MLLSIILHTTTFGLRDAIVTVLWSSTNSSELQSAPMLLGRRDNLQFKGGFPFSAKCRAIDFKRALSFEICEVNHS